LLNRPAQAAQPEDIGLAGDVEVAPGDPGPARTETLLVQHFADQPAAGREAVCDVSERDNWVDTVVNHVRCDDDVECFGSDRLGQVLTGARIDLQPLGERGLARLRVWLDSVDRVAEVPAKCHQVAATASDIQDGRRPPGTPAVDLRLG
jgi:hypothetical protein